MPYFRKLYQTLKGVSGKPGGPVERFAELDYVHDPQIDRIVFICGLHRSGTTLLERLLSARCDTSCLRARVIESEGQHMQRVYAPATRYGGPGRFAFSAARADADLTALGDPVARGRDVLAAWRGFVVGESPVLLEKSPPNLTKIAWLRQAFPGSRFVIMTRDPRAVAGATRKWSGTSLPELVMHWSAAYSRALADFADNDCIALRYEDLMDDPTAELDRLAAFLDLAPRRNGSGLEERHRTLSNSNTRYIAAHDGMTYGMGAWDSFGYSL